MAADGPRMLDVPLYSSMDSDADEYSPKSPTLLEAREAVHVTPAAVRQMPSAQQRFFDFNHHTLAVSDRGSLYGISHGAGSLYDMGRVYTQDVDNTGDPDWRELEAKLYSADPGKAAPIPPVEVMGRRSPLSGVATEVASCPFTDAGGTNCYLFAAFSPEGTNPIWWRVQNADTGELMDAGLINTLAVTSFSQLYTSLYGPYGLRVVPNGASSSGANVMWQYQDTSGNLRIASTNYNGSTKTMSSPWTLNMGASESFGVTPDPDFANSIWVAVSRAASILVSRVSADSGSVVRSNSKAHPSTLTPQIWSSTGMAVTSNAVWVSFTADDAGKSVTWLYRFANDASITYEDDYGSVFGDTIAAYKGGNHRQRLTTLTVTQDEDECVVFSQSHRVPPSYPHDHTYDEDNEFIVYAGKFVFSGGTINVTVDGVERFYSCGLYGHAFQRENHACVALLTGNDIDSALTVVGFNEDTYTFHPIARCGVRAVSDIVRHYRPASMNVDWWELPWDSSQVFTTYTAFDRTGTPSAGDAVWSGRSVWLDFEPKPLPWLRSSGVVDVYAGLPAYIDGAAGGEQHPHARPLIDVSETAGSGWTSGGTYSFVALFTWIDADGRLHRGTPSAPVSFTPTGSNTVLVEVTIPPINANDLSSDNRKIFDVQIYATEDGGEIYHLVRVQSVDDSTRKGIWRFTTVSEPDGDEPILYTDGGIRSAHVPPAFYDVAQVRDRTWAIEAERRDLVWASKPQEYGTAVEWNDTQIYPIPGGECTAVAELKGQVLIFQRDAVWTFYGDGPDANGQGQQWSAPTKVASVGALDRGGVVTTEAGVFFESIYGIMLMDPSMQVQPVGRPVRDQIESTGIQRAVDLQDAGTVLFTQTEWNGSDATSLLYSYRTGRWSVSDSLAAQDAVVHDDDLVYLKDDQTGDVIKADLVDHNGQRAETLTVITPWIRPLGENGSMVVNDVLVDLHVFADTDVNITVYTDYDTTKLYEFAVAGLSNTTARHTISCGFAARCRSLKIKVDVASGDVSTTTETARPMTATVVFGVEPGPERRNVTKANRAGLAAS